MKERLVATEKMNGELITAQITWPVCGKYTFDIFNDFDVCPFCKWENDGVQMNEPYIPRA